MSVICLVCDKIFTKQSNLNRHLQNVHNLEPKPVSYDNNIWNYKCLETSCNNSFPRCESLIIHLQTVHNVIFEETEEIVFSNKSGKSVPTYYFFKVIFPTDF